MRQDLAALLLKKLIAQETLPLMRKDSSYMVPSPRRAVELRGRFLRSPVSLHLLWRMSRRLRQIPCRARAHIVLHLHRNLEFE